MPDKFDIPGFEIYELIGHGGMGSVYRAKQFDLDREVAIKVIHRHLAEDPAFRSRFQAEMKMASAINHPNIVSLFEAGDEGGELFISMALIPGDNLAESLRKKGRLGPGEASSIISQIASALDAAHDKGIIHRDVKPGNVLIDRRVNHAYLTDFGIAKSLEATQSHTATGQAIGAIRYISPEQAKNESLDERADVYSLGCVLYEALTGDLVFGHGSDASILLAKVNGEIDLPSSSVSSLNPAFDSIMEKAMAVDPDDRFQSAGDLALAVEAASTGKDVTRALGPVGRREQKTRVIGGVSPSAPGGETKIQPRATSRNRSWMGTAAVLLLAVLAAGVGYGISQMGGESDNSAPLPKNPRTASVQEPEQTPSPPVQEVEPEPPAASQAFLPLVPVSTSAFDGQVPRDWIWKTKDEAVSSIRTMNVWEDPTDPLIDVQIDNQAAAGVDPLDSALSVRDENSSSIDGYREIGIGPISLAGKPAAQWTFTALEDGQLIRKMDIFFTSCETDFAVVGAAPTTQFTDYRQTFKKIAASIDAC